MTERIKQLDGLRLICAIMILLSHADYLEFMPIIGDIVNFVVRPRYACLYFFVILTGFGIFNSHNSYKLNNIISVKECIKYAIDRTKSIYPFYLLSMIISMPLVLYNTYNFTDNIIMSTIKMFLKFFMNTFLIQSLTGISDFSNAINDVCWFTSCMFVCYIFCPYFYRKIKAMNSKRVLISYAIIIAILSSIFRIFMLKIENLNISFLNMSFNTLHHSFPLSNIGYMILGMCVSRFIEIGGKKINLYIRIVIYILAFILFFTEYTIIEKNIIFNCLFIITLILVFYIIVVENNIITRFLSNECLVKLSKTTMLIYLFHYPINQIISFAVIYNLDIFNKSIYFLIVVFMIEVIVIYYFVKYLYNRKDKIKNSNVLNAPLNFMRNLLE